MQFHLNGFRTGNPEISEASVEYKTTVNSDILPDEVDVLIIGCGPAGLTLAAQLAAFPDIKTQIIEQKSGPLLLGQAEASAYFVVRIALLSALYNAILTPIFFPLIRRLTQVSTKQRVGRW
jgi:alkyl hydroperoxide reductase subunit AhpF